MPREFILEGSQVVAVLFCSENILLLGTSMSTPAATDSKTSDLVLVHNCCFWRDNYEMVMRTRRRKTSQRTELLLLGCVTSWGTYQANVIKYMAQTPQNGSLHVFREGIAPEYDDPSNQNGGLFKITLQAPSCAALAFPAVCSSFALGHLPHHTAVNGVTFAQKGTSCGLKLWVGVRTKQMVAHIQEWLTKALDGFIESCLFCPIASLLASIQKRRAPQQPPPPMQQPEGLSPTNTVGILNMPPPPPPPPPSEMMPTANTAGNMRPITVDLLEQVHANEPSLWRHRRGFDMPTSCGSVGYSSSEAFNSNTNDQAHDSRLLSLSNDERIMEQNMEDGFRLTDVPQMAALKPEVPPRPSNGHDLVSEDDDVRYLMSRSRYSRAWATDAAAAVSKRLQTTAERCRVFPGEFMELVVVLQTSPQAPCCASFGTCGASFDDSDSLPIMG